MTPIEVLQSVVDSAGRLRRAVAHHYGGDPDFVSHVVLEFESGRLVLSANDQDDSIQLSTELPPAPDCTPCKALSWAPGYGRSLLWAWTLTNHQGYLDGVRFDFRDTVSQSPFIIEVVVEALTLHTVIVPGAA